MDFVLFLLVNATLFLRPRDLFPESFDVPLYEGLIVACLAAAWSRVAGQMTFRSLAASPITVFVLGLLGAVVLSQLAQLNVWGARFGGTEFGKVALYYLLLVATVNTLPRLRWFVTAQVGVIVALTLLAVLHYHGVIDIPSLAAVDQSEVDPVTGEVISFARLQGVGIYNDPNDLGVLLAFGMILALFLFRDGSSLVGRALGLAGFGLFGYALLLTLSRGSLLALVAGLFVLFMVRFGWRKALAVAVLGLPAVFYLVGGRQANLSVSDGTGQQRIQIWEEGLWLFRQSPLFGIGHGQFAEEVGLVAHNSFLHTFTELGLVGGTVFVGAFFCALLALARLGLNSARAGDQALGRLRPYLAAAVTTYMIGLLSLSRAYVAPTYMVLGLAAVACRLARPHLPRPIVRLDLPLLGQVAAVSVLTLAGLYLFVRLFARGG